MVLAGENGRRQVAARCCNSALAAGVRPGMPLTQARAIFPPGAGALRIEPFSEERERSALRALAVWALRFSPLCAPDEPDGLLIDVTGCARVFAGEERLARLVESSLRRLGIAARLALAPSFACAWAVARFGGRAISIIETGREREAIAPLPVEALRLDRETLQGLHEVGLERVESLLAVPRSALAGRFGEGLLRRIDLALGAATETIDPVRPLEPVRAERVFDGPTTQWEAIEGATRMLVDELAALLAARCCGVRDLEVVLRRSDLPALSIVVRLGRPSREARHLWSILRPKLEQANIGFGVEGIALVARRAGRIRAEQAGFFGRRKRADISSDARLDETIDTLANRLGPQRVLRLEPLQTHIPERAFRMTGALEDRVAPPATGAIVTAQDRPTLLIEPPAPVRVMALTPDGPVASVAWQGCERRAAASIGPERIGGEWWRGESETRDYFRVQEEGGRWLWLFRLAEGEGSGGGKGQRDKGTEGQRGNRGGALLARESGGWFLQGVWT